MNKYQVTLKYPKTSRLEDYSEEVIALTQAEARLTAQMNGFRKGRRAQPKESIVTIIGELK